MAFSSQAQSILVDVIEYLTEEIIFADNPYDRLEKWEALQDFWTLLPEKKEYGRLFARYRLAKIMTAVAHTDAYSQEEIVFSGKKKSFLSPALPMVRWSPLHWTDLERLLENTRDILLREDADFLEEDNDEDNDSRAESDLYRQKVNRLLQYIRINKALADFRQSLHEQLIQKDANIKVDPSTLAMFGEIVESDFANDERAREVLESLLVRGKPGTSTRSHGVSLVSGDELRATLANKPFCLNTLSRKLELLLQRWARDVFAEKPMLSRLGYNPDKLIVAAKVKLQRDGEEEEDVKQPVAAQEPMSIIEEESDDSNDENDSPSSRQKTARRPKRKRDTSVDPGLEKLKSARRELQNEGTDPMQEIQRIAAMATRSSPKRSTLLEKKESATRVQFGDSDEEDDSDDDEGTRAHLSEVPARARLPTRKAKSPKKKVASGPKKRVPFSDEEKTAIRRGVETHGVGKWSEIKSDYAVILRNRTSVNIKDCYRTMKKKGEL